MSRIERIRHIYQTADRPFEALWRWAAGADSRKERYLRFRTLQLWAGERKEAEPNNAKVWEDRRRAYRRKKRHIHKALTQSDGWPSSIHVAELLYHDPPHCHFASTERNKLIAIGKIAEGKWGLRVGEFPPFDTVECVHVSGSWHYRDSSAPYVARSCAGRGDGLAMDVTGVRQYAFYLELRSRYG